MIVVTLLTWRIVSQYLLFYCCMYILTFLTLPWVRLGGSQRTLTMFVGVVVLRYGVDNGVPQLPQT